MNIRDFFDNPDDAFIDRITEEYPILDTDKKERLYAMSEKKYNRAKKENTKNYIEVSGVERYRKPAWQKVISAVAAAVVVLGGIGGGALLLGKGGGFDPMTDIEATEPAEEKVTEASEAEATDAAEIEETEPEIEQADYDYTAIAQQLFDDYLEVERIIRWGDVSYDENDSITFYTYNSNDAEWSDNNVGERTFYKVTDERFSSCQDIYEMLRAITTTECEPEENFMNAYWFDQVNLSSSLGGDVSMFEVGENIDINHEISDWRWPGYSINRSVFVEYNGELYVNRRYSETPEFTSDVIINETGENSFTATRKYKSPINSMEKCYNFEFVLENGEWKINHIDEQLI